MSHLLYLLSELSGLCEEYVCRRNSKRFGVGVSGVHCKSKLEHPEYEADQLHLLGIRICVKKCA
jgi:hypothetical protein